MKTALMGLTLALMLPVSAQAAWHAIMVSGDDSIRNFDNSRDALGELFAAKGLAAENQHHLNSQFSLEAKPPADQATLQALALSFTQLNIRPEQDACLFYVSSHGKQGDGVYMKRVHDGQLTPAQLNTALNWTCGTAPTVVMVSACYSGQFIQPLHADNRIIMTAASAQRPSFGCSEAQEYTFWDGCVIDHFERSSTWENLYTNVKQCIAQKEQQLGYPASQPQAYFGKNMRGLTLDFSASR
ncbi:MAG: hypothetical protein KA221_00290 [Vitreoscilla sp.]|nr:hypothetical protein [Vitreoscilla sp.]MBP9539507.1 hypothetical protein [Vitreoscilla sp.]